MLVEFSVANYRSIADKVTLSMIAAPIKSGSHAASLDTQNVIYIDDKLSLLKTVAIYGANASGKSNVLRALTAMGQYMQLSVVVEEMSLLRNKKPIFPYEPFLLREGGENETSFFEIVFLMEGKQYRYGFEISASCVEKEWLYFVPSTREALLFEREKETFKIGAMFKKAQGLEERVTEKALFLTVARDFNVKIARDIFGWLSRFPTMADETFESGFTIWCLEAPERSEGIVEFIKQSDVGISDIQVLDVSDKQEAAIRKDYDSYVVETVHKVYNQMGQLIGSQKLDMGHHASDGTRKLFAIAGKIVTVLREGHILLLDEIDSKLHPALTRKIIELFHSSKTNPNNAQLIFATHDTNLLDNQLMRRDQIWFTEKNRMGATDLYSLAELKVRNDALYQKDYIEGRYGAIPFPGSFSNLFDDREETDAVTE